DVGTQEHALCGVFSLFGVPVFEVRSNTKQIRVFGCARPVLTGASNEKRDRRSACGNSCGSVVETGQIALEAGCSTVRSILCDWNHRGTLHDMGRAEFCWRARKQV